MKRIIIIPLILVLLVGLVNAGEEFDFQEWLNDNIYSVLGQNLRCDIQPCLTNTFSSSKSISCCSSNSDYSTSNKCLINIFHANYQGTIPASDCGTPETGERNNCIEYKVTNSKSINPLGSNSIYEVYNCPSNVDFTTTTPDIQDCDCDYGATSTKCDNTNLCKADYPICLSQVGDDKCINTGQFFNICPNGYDGSKQECDCDWSYSDNNWKTRKCPSSKPICYHTTPWDKCVTSDGGQSTLLCKTLSLTGADINICGSIYDGGGMSCPNINEYMWGNNNGYWDFIKCSSGKTCFSGNCETENTCSQRNGKICQNNQYCYSSKDNIYIQFIKTSDTDKCCTDINFGADCYTIQGQGNKQKGISASDIESMTAEDLAASACTKTEQCEDGTCRPIKYLVDNGYITEEKKNGLLDKSAMFFGSAGGVGGLAACAGTAALATAATGGAGTILFPLCAFGGAMLGLELNEIFDSFASEDATKAGYCIKEGEGGGFCIKFADDILRKYTHLDCQTNTILFIIGAIAIIGALAK